MQIPLFQETSLYHLATWHNIKGNVQILDNQEKIEEHKRALAACWTIHPYKEF
jgi:hypothetical protein